jgi:Ca2+-binding EF-hand superfamily protein
VFTPAAPQEKQQRQQAPAAAMAAIERERLEAKIADKIKEQISWIPGQKVENDATGILAQYKSGMSEKSWADMSRPEDPLPFMFRELASSEDVVEQYLKLKPLFEEVFQKYDTDKNGVLDAKEFKAFQKTLMQGALGDAWWAFERAIKTSKDVFRKSMEESKIQWKNMPKEEDSDVVTWENFWAFFSSDKRLEMIKKDGLRHTFLMFAACGAPTYQEIFMALKPKFVEAFKMYDADRNGYLDAVEFNQLAEDSIRGRPDIEEFLDEMDENGDGKITWGEFWKFFSTGRNYATDQDELDRTFALLEAWNVGTF